MPSIESGLLKDRPAPGYLLAGTILDPVSPRELRATTGAIAIGVRTETIREIGPVVELQRRYAGWPVVQAEDCVILPAFSDGHARLADYAVRGQAGDYLALGPLAWLDEVVYPEEAAYDDSAYAHGCCADFFEAALQQGTVTAFVVTPPQQDTLAAFFDASVAGRWYAGNVIADAMASQPYRATTEQAVQNLENSAFRFGKKFVVSPRAVPACSDEVLELAGALSFDDEVYTQVPLAVSADEVALIEQRTEGRETSTQVLHRAKLLGQRTLLSHCNYLTEPDWRVLNALDCIVVHTPGADEVFDSQALPLEKLYEHRLRWALGSAVGASPSLSMLYAIQAFLRVHAYTGSPDLASEALYRATVAIPSILKHDPSGRIEPGHSADLVVCRCPEAARLAEPERILRTLVEGSVAELEQRPVATIRRGHLVAGRLPELTGSGGS